MKIILTSLAIILTASLGTGIAYLVKKSIPGQTSSNLQTVMVKQGEFVIALYDTGIIKAKNASLVILPRQRRTDELKISKLIPEGSQVKAGDPICWFDMTDLQKQLQDNEYQINRYKANLNNNLEAVRLQRENRSRVMQGKKLDWDSAKLEFELEAKKYEKVKRLVTEQILPQKDLEEEEHLYRSAKLKVDQTEKEFLKAAEQEASDERMKVIDIEGSRSQSSWYQREYDEIKKIIDQSVLTSPREGIVIYQKAWRNRAMQSVKEGDMIDPGEPVAFVPDLRAIQVMSQVAETDVSKVKLGLPVRIRMDAIPDLEMMGKIVTFGSLAIEREQSAGSGQVSTEESAGIKVFEVTIDMDTTDSRLRPGMTCKVEMIMETIPSALSVPLKAVRIGQEDRFVVIQNNGKTEQRKVVLGQQNDKEVIVESGIKANEEIILPEEGS